MGVAESSLLKYCQEGNYGAVKQLLVDKTGRIDINATTNEGSTGLLFACGYSNNIDIARLLLDRGANIHAKNNKGSTVLTLACQFPNNSRMVKLLLEKGADINGKNNEGSTGLLNVCRLSNDTEMVKLLLDKGADINATNNEGWTGLLLACLHSNDIDMVRVLLDGGADINTKNNNGENGLLIACQHSNNIELVRLLLDRGADIHAKNNEGSTALFNACRISKDIDMVRMLLDRGADINAARNDGLTVLDVASKRLGNKKEIRQLIIRHNKTEKADGKRIDQCQPKLVGDTNDEAGSNGKIDKFLTVLDVASKRLGNKKEEIRQLIIRHHNKTEKADGKRIDQCQPKMDGDRNDEAGSNGKIDKFYIKMLEDDDEIDIHMKIEELIPEIQNVTHAKIMYTYLSICRNKSGIITSENRKKYTIRMLEQAAQTTSDDNSISIYKIMLDKALGDGLINQLNYNNLDRKAEVTHTSNAQFVKDIHARLSIVEGKVQVLENRVDSIDNTVSQICDSVNTIKNAFQKQLRLKAVTGCMGAVLNVISMGAAGAALEGAANSVMSSIIDFSDLEHIKGIIDQEDIAENVDAFKIGETVMGNAVDGGQEKFNKILLEEMKKVGSKQSLIVHATIAAATISHAAEKMAEPTPVIPMGGKDKKEADNLVEATPAISMGEQKDELVKETDTLVEATPIVQMGENDKPVKETENLVEPTPPVTPMGEKDNLAKEAEYLELTRIIPEGEKDKPIKEATTLVEATPITPMGEKDKPVKEAEVLVVEATPIVPMGEKETPIKGKNIKERLDALAEALGVQFEEGFLPKDKVAFLEEQGEVEKAPGNLKARIEKLEDELL